MYDWKCCQKFCILQLRFILTLNPSLQFLASNIVPLLNPSSESILTLAWIKRPAKNHRYPYIKLYYYIYCISLHCKYFDCTRYSFWQCYICHCCLTLSIRVKDCIHSKAVLITIIASHVCYCHML